jgi:CheY-like chemotaxis protein
VLIVEDSDDDAILLIRMLNKGGYKVSYLRVDNLDDTRAALTEETWDVIISDYSLPSFNGLAALRLLHELEVDLPFIIVSGTIGEDLAVEAMRVWFRLFNENCRNRGCVMNANSESENWPRLPPSPPRCVWPPITTPFWQPCMTNSSILWPPTESRWMSGIQIQA